MCHINFTQLSNTPVNRVLCVVTSRGIMKQTTAADTNTTDQHIGLLLDVDPPNELIFYSGIQS